MAKNLLSKKLIKKFSISYNEALKMGITDQDLKYISETKPNVYRVSVPAEKRKTKVTHNLLDAIKIKYEFVKESENEKLELENINNLANENQITKYNSVQEGIDKYLISRKVEYNRGFIQITTYHQDLKESQSNRFILESKILEKKIKDVDVEYAQSFINYLWDSKNLNNNEKLSENTLYTPYSFIHKIFNYFSEELNIIDYNPFAKTKNKPQARSEAKEYFNVDEIHLIKSKLELENIRFRTLINLILDTGLRREEAVALKFSDINLQRNTIKIERAFVKSNYDNSLIIKDVKRKASEREIVAPTKIFDLIENVKTFKKSSGFIVKNDDYIFTAWDSLELISPNAYSVEFKKFINKLDINKKIPFKNLRHSHVTYFVEKGQNLKAIQKRLGHSNIETTLNVYAQSSLTEDRKLVNEFENEFYGRLGLSISDIYRIISNRFDDDKKLIYILEKISNEFIDGNNFDIQFEKCKNHFLELFPILEKILAIDSTINDEDINLIFSGFENKYRSIKITTLDNSIKF